MNLARPFKAGFWIEPIIVRRVVTVELLPYIMSRIFICTLFQQFKIFRIDARKGSVQSSLTVMRINQNLAAERRPIARGEPQRTPGKTANYRSPERAKDVEAKDFRPPGLSLCYFLPGVRCGSPLAMGRRSAAQNRFILTT
jgi:hypothetical protein